MELGWHPNLTLDRPIARPSEVPSLIQADGTFWPLGPFLMRLVLGLIRPQEIDKELRAQYARFVELAGHAPTMINSHHHVQVFKPVGQILLGILIGQRPRPYLRRIREPWSTLWHVPGAKVKRAVLCWLGTKLARTQHRSGLAGNDTLMGITNPPFVEDPEFLRRWLKHSPGHVVELTCHPGHRDLSLVGRDCTLVDGQLERRVNEFNLLRDSHFLDEVRRMGFSLASGSEATASAQMSFAHAA
jgi:predicted glycoside hydrolase/deacetylase ChbG (UPF0249 family)